jgi:hypothetical protein
MMTPEQLRTTYNDFLQSIRYQEAETLVNECEGYEILNAPYIVHVDSYELDDIISGSKWQRILVPLQIAFEDHDDFHERGGEQIDWLVENYGVSRLHTERKVLSDNSRWFGFLRIKGTLFHRYFIAFKDHTTAIHYKLRWYEGT